MQNNIGNLYIVATPIGNLKDITFRAIEILKEVDIIFCEDTRTTGMLLKKYEIENKTLQSYNAINGKSKNVQILNLLNEGKNIALVSDAGTPSISDPGYSLLNYLRENHFHKIIPIPGASALTTFLSGCGYGTNEFSFIGFLPHKNGRQKKLKEAIERKTSTIFYESTHRIEKCLLEIKKIEDKIPHRKIVIGRELTKIYEEYLIGTASDILEFFKKYPEKKKGEFVVMIV